MPLSIAKSAQELAVMLDNAETEQEALSMLAESHHMTASLQAKVEVKTKSHDPAIREAAIRALGASPVPKPSSAARVLLRSC